MPLLLIFGLLCIALGALLYRRRKRIERRQELLQGQLSDTEREIVADTVPLLRNLPPDMQTRLEGKMNLFLDQVEFIGCNGLDVTEEMELSIAAQACLLVLNTDAWYDHLRTILIYPGAFKSKTREHDGYVVRESEVVRSGESWQYGPVILSWAHSKQGALNTEDGHNVVLHEFAHQLDSLSGHTDGAPLLASGQSFAEWARVFTKAYRRHVEKTEAGHNTVLSPYAATSHEEFFAVAVEVFFEKPIRLQREEPEVYAQLSELLQLDPATWH
ncbi:MAG: M90 family metallopeptidase [Pseudomonadota bacterium]